MQRKWFPKIVRLFSNESFHNWKICFFSIFNVPKVQHTYTLTVEQFVNAISLSSQAKGVSVLKNLVFAQKKETRFFWRTSSQARWSQIFIKFVNRYVTSDLNPKSLGCSSLLDLTLLIWQSSTNVKKSCDTDEFDRLPLQLTRKYFLIDCSQSILFY